VTGERGIDGSSVVVASSNQLSSSIDDEAVILGLEQGVYYGLNPIGARIWALIQEPRQVSEIWELILAEYDVDRGRCERDIVAILTELDEQGLLELRNASAPA